MNPAWELIIKYMRSQKVTAGEYEFTTPDGKKFRVTQDLESKDWQVDNFNPEKLGGWEWEYRDHARTLKDAKVLLAEEFMGNNPPGSTGFKELQNKIRGHSRRGGGGGALPPDLIGSGKTLPRGLVRRDKRKY
jgi:hypothetical protein